MAGTLRVGGKVLATHDSGTDEISLDSATNTSNMSFDANHAGIKTALNASGDAPIYACRAWVNFRGTSQSGTLNISGPVTGLYTATVTSATTFTIEYSSTTYTVTTSGNHEVGDGKGVDLTISGTSVTIDTQIRESGNVSSINENAVGNYQINFDTPMPHSNYAVAAFGSNEENSFIALPSFGGPNGPSPAGAARSTYQQTGSVRVYFTNPASFTGGVDKETATVAIFC